MKKEKLLTIVIILFATTQLMAQQKDVVMKRDKGSITFMVDENLPKPDADRLYEGDGQWLAGALVQDKNLVKPREGLVACSFMNEHMAYGGKDVLFYTIVQCFAEHRPLVLSPDMVWLIIAQGFSHYANEHAEELRDKLVNHDGKLSLVVETTQDLFADNVDWTTILNSCSTQIMEHSKGDIAQTITADFTTTNTTERIASQVTLMDLTKAYFEYVVFNIACGIPSITLEGTPADWQKVHDKAMQFETYGLGWWTKDLDGILTEFVHAAEGKPNQAYWQDMVMINTPERLRGGACSQDKPTQLDGWFLKLFPFDKDGKRIAQSIPHNTSMLSEMVEVPFLYTKVHEDGHTTETPMEIHAGFVGVQEDSLTRSLTPQIGWMVRVSESPVLLAEKMAKQANGADSFAGLRLRVKEVPDVLKSLPVIDRLTLTFVDHIQLPEWMDGICINHFEIEGGELTHTEESAIKKRFPDLQLHGVSYLDTVK